MLSPVGTTKPLVPAILKYPEPVCVIVVMLSATVLVMTLSLMAKFASLIDPVPEALNARSVLLDNGLIVLPSIRMLSTSTLPVCNLVAVKFAVRLLLL